MKALKNISLAVLVLTVFLCKFGKAQSGEVEKKNDVQIEVKDGKEMPVDQLIVPGQRVGEFAFGMKKDDVLKRLGEPKSIIERRKGYDIYFDGICFNIVDDMVNNIAVLGHGYKFSNGLGVGSSERQITEAFGNNFYLKENEGKDFLTYEDKGLVFEIKKNERTVMEISVLNIADSLNPTSKPHVQIEVEKEKIAATKNLINLTSVEPNDITLEQFVEILKAMESAIVDVTIDYEWDEEPGYLAEQKNWRPRYQLQTARPFCKRILLTKTTSSIEKTSYNGKTLKHLSGNTATVVEGKLPEIGLSSSPLGFSIFALGSDLSEIRRDMSPPWDILKSKNKQCIHLYSRIEKINGFDTIRADLLLPNKQIYLRIYFSVEHGYTPVKWEYIMNGSEIASSVEVTSLQKVADGLWFPSSGIIHPRGKTKSEYRAVGKIVINQGLREEDFDIEFPSGTQVDDQVRGIKYIVTSIEVKNQNPAAQLEGCEEPGRMSMAGSGTMKKFYSAPGWGEILAGVVVYGLRYGDIEPLDDKFKMWVCDANLNVIREFEYDYRLFKRDKPDEVRLEIEPTRVPASYAVCLGFDSNERKGVYVYYNKRTAVVRGGVKGSPQSYIGLPGQGFREFDKGEWLIRSLTKVVIVPDEFMGSWKGQAIRLISGDAGIDKTWVPVRYEIGSDGMVTGKVGQAEITEGQLVNIGQSYIQTMAIGLTYEGRYAVYGRLKGEIEGQGIDGAYFQSIFNLEDGRLIGQIGTIIKNQNGNNEPFVLDKMSLEKVIWNEQVSPSADGERSERLKKINNPSTAPRLVEAGRLMKLGKWLLLYANDREGKYPSSLEELKQYAEDGNDFDWFVANVAYHGANKSAKNSPDTIIAYDKTMLAKNPGGTNVLYNDALVAFERADWLKKQGITAEQNNAGQIEDFK